MARGTNGTSSHVSFGAPAIGSLQAVTLAGWGYRSASGTTMGFGCYLSPQRFGFVHYSDDNVYAAVDDGAAQAYRYANSTASGWNHYAQRFDGTQATNANRLAFFLNGASFALVGGAGGTLPSSVPASPPACRFGSDNTGSDRFWAGRYAEGAFWDVLLTDSEIAALAKGVSPLLVRPTNLLNYYPLIGRYSPEIDPVGGASGTLTSSPTTQDHPRIIYPGRRRSVTVPSTSTTLSLPTLTAGSQIFAPTLTPGAVGLTLPTITSAELTFAPSLAQVVSLPTIPTGDQLFAPSLAYAVSLPTIASGAQLFAPSLAQTLTLPPISATSLVFAPTMAYAVSLPTIASGSQVFALTISTTDTLVLPTIASGEQLFAPSVTTGGVTLLLPTIGAGSQVFTPTVTPGAVTLALPTIIGSASLFPPSVTAIYGLALPTISVSSQTYAPTLTVGAVGLLLPTIATTTQLFAPRILSALATLEQDVITVDAMFHRTVTLDATIHRVMTVNVEH